MSEADFWANKERAQKNVEEVSSLRGKITPLLALERQIEDLTQQLTKADQTVADMTLHAPIAGTIHAADTNIQG